LTHALALHAEPPVGSPDGNLEPGTLR
jgi:hypothetical protein